MSIDYMMEPHLDVSGLYRQFGRYLTIASVNSINDKLIQVITGGTGGGFFIDVCYIVRKVLYDLGFYSAVVLGVLVLPDAILQKDGCQASYYTHVLPNWRNGCAALLEIEHLMNLKDSNEWFEQDYGTFKIRTQRSLVDVCRLVSSTNMNSVSVRNGYEYALNVISDYILAFLSEQDGYFRISLRLIYLSMLGDLQCINPSCGYSQNYFLIGAASGEIPRTQMVTYLATELFEKLTIRKKMPDTIQIEQEFAGYPMLSDAHFKDLENQIAGWTQITELDVKIYFDQIKAHMD